VNEKGGAARVIHNEKRAVRLIHNERRAVRLIYPAVVSFGMALAMSGLMSFAMTWIHSDTASPAQVVKAWLPAWGVAFPLAWPLAFTLVLTLLPRLLRLAAWAHALARKS